MQNKATYLFGKPVAPEHRQLFWDLLYKSHDENEQIAAIRSHIRFLRDENTQNPQAAIECLKRDFDPAWDKTNRTRLERFNRAAYIILVLLSLTAVAGIVLLAIAASLTPPGVSALAISMGVIGLAMLGGGVGGLVIIRSLLNLVRQTLLKTVFPDTHHASRQWLEEIAPRFRQALLLEEQDTVVPLDNKAQKELLSNEGSFRQTNWCQQAFQWLRGATPSATEASKETKDKPPLLRVQNN